MKVTRLTANTDTGNTYVLGEEGSPCLVFDFGDDAHHRSEAYIARHHGDCLGIFLTHAHYDHIYGLNDLYPDWKAPIFVSDQEYESLFSPKLNCSDSLFDDPFVASDSLPYYRFDDEDEIRLGHFLVKCILTPFHTKGSACFYLPEEKILFTGDTLFRGSVGRDDLPGAAPRQMESSLKKLLSLPKETKVYPGHGPSSTLGDEFCFNPFLKGLK